MPLRDNFYSEEVQSIMGKAPSWVIRWGITVVSVIFGGIFLGCYFVKYPDVIISPAQITTYNPPVDLITRSEGLIDTLCVGDGDFVKRGDLIAILNNTADWNDLQFLSDKLELLSRADCADFVSESWINDSYILGDVQTAFSAFQKACRDYRDYILVKHILMKQRLLRDQISKNKEHFNMLKKQHEYIISDLKLQKGLFARDSILFFTKVISSADFEISSQNLLLKQNSESGFKATLSATELQIIRLEQQLIELALQLEIESAEYKRIVMQTYQQLLAGIVQWEMLYVLKAPVSGNITFVSYWNKNQHIKISEKLASIIPNGETRIIGRVQVPSAGFGKVKIGQDVIIKLNGFPYMEFGVLRGQISSLSAVPENVKTQSGNMIVYMAEVAFPSDLKTSYGNQLPLIQQMDGIGEIITEDMRLISRFFNPIVSLFKNR